MLFLLGAGSAFADNTPPHKILVMKASKADGGTVFSIGLNANVDHVKNPLAYDMEFNCTPDEEEFTITFNDLKSETSGPVMFGEFVEVNECWAVQKKLLSNYKNKITSCLALDAYRNVVVLSASACTGAVNPL